MDSDADDLKDNKWHQICASWSHSKSKVFLYIDGVSVNSKATSSHSNPLNTAGMLVIGKDGGSNTFHITELNLWDRELSEDEISKNAKQCDGLKGNVKRWHVFYETANEKGNEVISSPSKCKATGSSRSTSPAKGRHF